MVFGSRTRHGVLGELTALPQIPC